MILAPCGGPGADRDGAAGGRGGGSQGWPAEVGRSVGRRVGTVGTRPRQGRRVETELDFLNVPGKEEWGRSCNRTWEQLLRGGA